MSAVHPDVIAMARAGEPERYLAATLSPVPVRADLMALAAFAADLRRIPAVVKEPLMGEVRLQWWRDVIGAIDAGGATGHPVADALGVAVRRHRLPTLSLVAMTEARAFDLYDDPMPDAAAFAGYLAKTEAIPFELAGAILGQRAGQSLADLGARCFGHARLLAALPVWLSKRRLPVPLTLLQDQGVALEQLLDGRADPALRAAMRRQCGEIATAYAALQAAVRAGGPGARLALLPAATVPAYLRAIADPARDPVRHPAEISALARVARIGRARWLGL